MSHLCGVENEHWGFLALDISPVVNLSEIILLNLKFLDMSKWPTNPDKVFSAAEVEAKLVREWPEMRCHSGCNLSH